MGDFNFKHIDWDCMATNTGDESSESEFVDQIKDLFLHQHVKASTRFREGGQPSLLYLIFTNEEDIISDFSFHSSLRKSDHLCLKFDFICYKEIRTVDTRKFN